MLTKSEFKILSALHAEPLTSQREVTERSGVSLGTANKHLKSLREQGPVSYTHLDVYKRQ